MEKTLKTQNEIDSDTFRKILIIITASMTEIIHVSQYPVFYYVLNIQYKDIHRKCTDSVLSTNLCNFYSLFSSLQIIYTDRETRVGGGSAPF